MLISIFYVTQFRVSSASACLSHGLGGLFDQITPTLSPKRLQPLVTMTFSARFAAVVHLLIILSRRVRRDALVNYLVV